MTKPLSRKEWQDFVDNATLYEAPPYATLMRIYSTVDKAFSDLDNKETEIEGLRLRAGGVFNEIEIRAPNGDHSGQVREFVDARKVRAKAVKAALDEVRPAIKAAWQELGFMLRNSPERKGGKYSETFRMLEAAVNFAFRPEDVIVAGLEAKPSAEESDDV